MSDHIEYIECACTGKDDLVRITLWDNGTHHGKFRDVEVYFEIPVNSAGFSFRTRLHAAWEILRGRQLKWIDANPMYTYKEFVKFRESVNKIGDIIEAGNPVVTDEEPQTPQQ